MNNQTNVSVSSEAAKSLVTKQSIYGGILIFVFWTVIGISATIQTYIHYYVHSDEGQAGITWFHHLVEILPPWYYWALITPLVFGISRKLPFERGRPVWVTFLIHLILSIALTLPYLVIASFFYRIALEAPITLSGIWQTTISRIVSRFNFALLTYWAILGFGIALDYYKRLQQKELESAKVAFDLENQLIKANLDVLKMQLHPHFLFNTLNSISGIMARDIKGARNMIASLSEILRFNLASSDHQTISVRKEIELLNLYLEIERERFKDNLEVRINIQPETLDCRIPQFILQPIVENAIKHGISNINTKGIIEINAFREKDNVLIEIKDNGEGFPQKPQHGVGLSNTKSRLEKLYKEKYEFTVVARRDIGTTVSLKIPFDLNDLSEKP